MGVSGCSSVASGQAIPYEITLVVDKDANLSDTRRPLPIQVDLYELKGGGQFERSDYFSLQDKTSVAAPEIVSSQQYILQPGESRTISRPGSADARMLGVVAGYRALEASRWRLVQPLTAPRAFWVGGSSAVRLTVAVRRAGLSVAEPPAPRLPSPGSPAVAPSYRPAAPALPPTSAGPR